MKTTNLWLWRWIRQEVVKARLLEFRLLGCPKCGAVEVMGEPAPLAGYRRTWIGVVRTRTGYGVVCADCGQAYSVSRRGSWVPKMLTPKKRPEVEGAPPLRGFRDADLRFREKRD